VEVELDWMGGVVLALMSSHDIWVGLGDMFTILLCVCSSWLVLRGLIDGLID
jgi:hypothetical protein